MKEPKWKRRGKKLEVVHVEPRFQKEHNYQMKKERMLLEIDQKEQKMMMHTETNRTKPKLKEERDWWSEEGDLESDVSCEDEVLYRTEPNKSDPN